MGTKENFNQAMHEVFPFYKGAKATNARTDNLAEQSDTDILPESGETSELVDFQSIYGAKKQESIETAYITKDTKITGTIVTKSNIDISGDVFGDVESQNAIRVSGKIEGNINGKDVEINHATIKGQIQTSERLNISNESVIIGNISANELEFNSKINGNINVKKAIVIKKDSSVVGDITAMSIDIERGAAIKGMMVITGERSSEEENS